MFRRSKNILQAYQQAPWRRQMQIIGYIAAGLVAVTLVSALYLNITARAATAGRLVLYSRRDISDAEQRIEDLKTQLASISSTEVMQQRASELGFKPVSPHAITYLHVAEYQGRALGVQLAPGAGSRFGSTLRLPESYTQSLFDWVGGLFLELGGF